MAAYENDLPGSQLFWDELCAWLRTDTAHREAFAVA
jgi:hypothetical protein